MEEQMVLCAECEDEILEEDAYYFNDQYYCESCLDEMTFICADCGDRLSDRRNEGNDTISLCPDCRSRYESCEDCSALMHRDNCNYDEDGYPYCDNCYDRHETGRYLHRYDFKPELIFYGDGNRFFGVELEIDDGGKSDYNAELLTDIGNMRHEHIYVKGDGSLNNGIEIVSHPMTLAYHMNEMSWEDIIHKALSLGYRSHQTDTCGLHIHVGREYFGTNRDNQECSISRVLFFMERFWTEMLRFSRRSESQVKRWADRYGYKDKPKDILEHAKCSITSRYAAVNITNYETIEFRLFRGSLKHTTLIAALQMVNEICDAAFSMSDEEFSALSWCSFMERINPAESSELVTYLKECRLYINEPVCVEVEC